MIEYYFLFLVGLLAVLFAVVQDLRTREIANWVTFSLIAFVLAYRLFYSIHTGDFLFFVYGLCGVVLFAVLGYFFYYLGVFAGGDAKLLFGLGGIIPYYSPVDYVFHGLGFFLVLFTAGIFYTLIYSSLLLRRNWKTFKFEFVREFRSGKIISIFCLVAFALLFNFGDLYRSVSFVALLFPLIYFYAMAVEKSCMVKLTNPEKLTEGDWITSDIKIGRSFILKTVHGLSYEDILLLRRHKKFVFVKNGVPFAPAFLISLVFVIIYFLL